jgi:uncharacterized protein
MNFQMKSYMVKNNFWTSVLTGWLFVFLGLTHVYSQTDTSVFPPKPEPAVYVHDYSDWLSAGEKQQLELKLRGYWDSTSTQIVVMIRPDLGDYDRATYAIELGNRWGIGDEKKDNGVVLLVKTEAPDRGVFIATGYGAEGGLTDLEAGRIIRNTMAPFFRSQQYYAGIEAGTDAIIAALEGEFTRSDSDTAHLSKGEEKVVILLLLVLFLIIFGIILAVRSKRKGEWYNRRGSFEDGYFPGGWWHTGGGSNWGSGSGWGSGGSSGGSFGGGDFGGGGAGGDW